MGHPTRKQYLAIDGTPILTRTIDVFYHHPEIDRVFVVVPEEDMDYCVACILPVCKDGTVSLVAGGAERQESVYNGLAALPETTDMVVVHDGVRPFIRPEQISSCIAAAKQHKAAILGIPVADTLKRVDTDGKVVQTIERQLLYQVQTPQVFDYGLLKKAHETSRKIGLQATDDAALVEHMGRPVKMVEGDKLNIKITIPEDLILARFIISRFLPGR